MMRCVAVLTGALTLGFMHAAAAQDTDVTTLQLKACTLIQDDVARVRCYDHAMSRPNSAPSMVSVGSAPGLVTISPSTTTNAQPTSIGSQLPVGLPQSPSPTRSATAVEVPAAPKPENTNMFGVGTVMRALNPSAVTALIQPSPGKNEAWQVQADKSDLQQASRLIGTLKSVDEKSALVLQCQNGGTQALVSTNSFLGWETVRVLYRVNGNSPVDNRWPTSRDGRGAIANNATELINSLPDGGTIDIRLVDYNDTNHDLRFDLGAVSSLRSQIATVCRWPGAVVEEKVVSEKKLPNQRSANPNAPTRVGPPLQLQ